MVWSTYRTTTVLHLASRVQKEYVPYLVIPGIVIPYNHTRIDADLKEEMMPKRVRLVFMLGYDLSTVMKREGSLRER